MTSRLTRRTFIELGATGELVKGWTLQASYSYIDSEITNDNSCGGTPAVCNPNIYTIGKPVLFVPKNAASLWTTVDLDKLVDGLEIGGGVTWQDKIPVTYTIAGVAPNPTGLSRIAIIPENVSIDAVVSYRIDRYRLQLNGQNLADRTNYAQIFANRGVPAPGRTVLLTFGMAF